MERNAEINIKVTLNEKNFPQKIEWNATDSGFEGMKAADAMLLSFWDKDEKATLSIDLWTDEMFVEEMNSHYFQVLLKMADTLYNASKNAEIAEFIKKFAIDFAQKTNVKLNQ